MSTFTADDDTAETTIGAHTFKVERTDIPDAYGERRVTYRWSVLREGELVGTDADLHTGVDMDHGPAPMLVTFLHFLGAEAERRGTIERGGFSADGPLFEHLIGTVAYDLSDEITMRALEIEVESAEHDCGFCGASTEFVGYGTGSEPMSLWRCEECSLVTKVLPNL